MPNVARQALPRFLQKGKADTATQPVYSGGQLVAPSSGTYTLKDANGTTVLDGLAVTIGADKIASRAIASTWADSHSLPQPTWREVWSLVIDGTTETVEREVMVCRVAPVRHVTDQDLFRMHSNWSRSMPPGRTSYEEPIELAWEDLIARLLGDQVFPNRVLNWWTVARVHRLMAAAIVCRDFSTTEGREGKWGQLAADYGKDADSLYDKTFLRRDEDEDGVGSSDGRQVAAEPELFLTYIPPATGWIP